MITSDPERRAARLNEVLDIIRRERPSEALLPAFVPAVFTELPDRLSLDVPAEALARRLGGYFDFFVHAMPPATQLYRGLPGIHVVARNPEDDDATVLEAHTPDAPFIFENLKNYFRKAGLRVFDALHPILTVRRQWERIVWLGPPRAEGTQELFCHFRIERVESKERLRRLEHEVFAVLKGIFLAVEDFPDMCRSLEDLLPRLRSPLGRADEVESARAFLRWLPDNYIFQGLARYRLGPDGLPDRIPESAAGVFTDPALLPVVFPGLVEEVEGHLSPSGGDRRLIDIDYCNNAAAIYQLEPVDDIVVRQWSEDGRLVEAMLIVGRFAKGAFTQRIAEVPLLREKCEWLLEHCGAEEGTHAYRETRAVFNRFPIRELFYAEPAALKRVIDGIVHMAGDEEIVVHARQGAGYVTLALAFSRARHSYQLEAALRRDFADEFGPVTFATSEDCGNAMVLLYYFDAARLEHEVDALRARELVERRITTWPDLVARALDAAYGPREGRRLFERYITDESRSGIYREITAPDEVADDLRRLDELESRLELRLIPRAPDAVTLRVFSVHPLALTWILRTLGDLGLTVIDDTQVPLTLPSGRKAFLYKLEVEAPVQRVAALRSGFERFLDALRALDERRASEDALNGLILDAGLSWRQVEVLRTLRNHILQVRSHYNVETVNRVLLRNAFVAAALFRAFGARFDPAEKAPRDEAMAQAAGALRQALEKVESLPEDEVLRSFVNLIASALRTNFYQRPERPVISIKVDSAKVEGMKSPRPMFEIYVHSPLLEGIHLRGGKVARGGLRWSDRHDDFRTEILGLMKTQMVKNSIIVPVGSKGGFVLKGDVPPRPALDAYLIDRYREFICGLLDVTDNIVDGQILHPPEVVRHDGDDPYLVVAADKGTAHLSDTANSVSAQYGFWLGDAFASGGGAGYDHKRMGITAKGAWECVRHHFHLLGRDIQREPFTAVGIGDMAGDVFGNGALLSPELRLIAAFNHVHIFIDPDPDPVASFAERKRLFGLPRSTWRDYDATLISAGGGIFDRAARAIPVSPQMRAVLGLEGDTASGEEVIRKILTAPVDLLYNGGIGTYVKAGAETDVQVADRANDRVRVDAARVRAKVIGEGGNLGLTQKARLEYWAGGGLLNTDAVDNSGGVDTSDHEVNIKILMNVLIKKGAVKGREERNRILAQMTDEVAELVLDDNRNQARAITLDNLRSRERYEEFVAFIEDCVASGMLNRADESIPGRDELLHSPQRERGLPRPLLAVLLGYVKMSAFQKLLETDFPDSPAAQPWLDVYFPARLQPFRAHFAEHTLRREIIATVAVNRLVNEAGVTFLWRLLNDTKAELGELVAAWLTVERRSGAPALRDQIESAGLGADGAHRVLLEVEAQLEGLARGVLAGDTPDAEHALDPIRARLSSGAGQ